MHTINEQVIELILSIMLIIFPKDTPIMNIKIDKLKINNPIYEKGSINNNIDKNVIILDESDYPDKQNGTVLIGAHSGTAKESYFKNLNKLVVGDTIKLTYKELISYRLLQLTYKDKLYTYKVDKISKDNKDGKISITYENKENRLVLFTCYPKDKNNYLIVSSYLSN